MMLPLRKSQIGRKANVQKSGHPTPSPIARTTGADDDQKYFF
jgi:hypothetical protein